MKNSILFLATITLTLFVTSCSDDNVIGVTGDSTSEVTSTIEKDPETGLERVVEQVNMEEILADANTKTIDISDIIEKDAMKALKEGADQKSILVNIYNRHGFVSHGGWFTVQYYTSSLRNCYYQYRVTIIPSSGDPDVSIWGYDHSRYNKWRRVRGATYYPGHGREQTYFKKCDFGHYEEKAVIGVYADQGRSTNFRIKIDRIS